MPQVPQQTHERVLYFVDLLQERENKHITEHFPNIDPAEFSVNIGQKFIRIVKGGSAYCFIDIATGDILKSETWSRPSKQPRGNIFNSDPLQGTDVYGARYLK